MLSWLAVGCQLSPRTGLNAQEDVWREVQTPHFTVDSDLPELAVREVAENLEQMRAALIVAAWTGARNPPRGRIDVVVFRRRSEFERYSGQSAQAVGIAISRPGFRRMLSFSPGQENGIPTVVTHELAHDLSAWFLPIQPTWFAEGIATFLETTKYDPSTQTATFGEPSEDRLRSVVRNRGFNSAEQLFAARESVDVDARVSESFYASAWLFTHFLLNAEGDRFGQFQTRLAGLQEWQHAWQDSFPEVTPKMLDEQLMAYLGDGGRFTTFTTPVPLEPFQATLRVLSPAEVHGVLAWLTNRSDQERAESETAEALRLDPDELRALVVRFHALDASASAARRELAQRAVAAHPESSDAWLLAARAQAGEERRKALQTALRLEPEHPGVLTLLAQDLVQQDRAADALAYTQLALKRSAPSFELVQLHLAALIARHQCRAAEWLEGNAEQRFQEGCTATIGGTLVSCGQLLRDTWIERNQSCALARTASAAARRRGAAAEAAEAAEAEPAPPR